MAKKSRNPIAMSLRSPSKRPQVVGDKRRKLKAKAEQKEMRS